MGLGATSSPAKTRQSTTAMTKIGRHQDPEEVPGRGVIGAGGVSQRCAMLDDKLGRAFCEFNIKFKRVCKEMRKMEIIIYTNFHSIIGIYITFDNGPVLDTVSESYLSFRRK